VAELSARRDAGVAALREAGFVLDLPLATMYLWVPLPAGVAAADFSRRALEEQGVVVLPGSAFGAAGEGFFRIALTVGAERIREAVRRLGRVLESSRAA
jgi:LL-diaminopimelate aminotransferase